MARSVTLCAVALFEQHFEGIDKMLDRMIYSLRLRHRNSRKFADTKGLVDSVVGTAYTEAGLEGMTVKELYNHLVEEADWDWLTAGKYVATDFEMYSQLVGSEPE